MALSAPVYGVQRTFVHSSPFGSDTNTSLSCSLTAPCRSFNAAISVTDPNGEVVILDTAGYGSMTIGKSIKIIGPSGVYGGISVLTPGTDGITINASDADVVTLRGLDVTGLGGLNGINIMNAKAVHIEKSTISGFADPAGACVKIDSAKNIRVFINDSFLRNCEIGARVNGSAASARPRLVLENTRIERGTGTNTDIGVWATNSVDLSIRNSVLTSLGYGLRFENTLPGANPMATLFNTSIHGVNNGVVVSNSATSQVTVEMNGVEIANTDTGIDMSATNNSTLNVYLADSRVSRYGIGLKTGGTPGSGLRAYLLRSQLEHGGTAVEHHLGGVVLNATQIAFHGNSLVNAGSGNVWSLNNNLIFDNADSTAGVTYITTPAIIAVK